MSVQISVSEDFEKVVSRIMKDKGYETKGEAVDYIGQVFTSRYKAVTKYAENHKAAPKKPAKKAKAKKAKAQA